LASNFDLIEEKDGLFRRTAGAMTSYEIDRCLIHGTQSSKVLRRGGVCDEPSSMFGCS
jgi:hypothetical protein